MGKQSPFLIKKRILERGKLWGVIAENQSKLFKINIADLLKLLVVDNRTVLVDFAGEDKPSTLTVVNNNGKYYFRTIKDQEVRNNFNKVKAVKLISMNKVKVYK